MQGFGHVVGYPVLSDSRIFNLATGRAEVAVEPLHHWHEHRHMPEGIGLGLAMPFALELLKVRPEMAIGFVPAARGGSHLDQWLPEAENYERAVFLWERAAGNHPEAELAGILWHQGEADSAEAGDAASYGSRFKETIREFRRRFGNPALPVVAGELGRFLAENAFYKHHATVVEQTRQAVRELGNAAFVSSEGLSCDGGHTHFETPAIREFGVRYAEAYRQLESKN